MVLVGVVLIGASLSKPHHVGSTVKSVFLLARYLTVAIWLKTVYNGCRGCCPNYDMEQALTNLPYFSLSHIYIYHSFPVVDLGGYYVAM